LVFNALNTSSDDLPLWGMLITVSASFCPFDMTVLFVHHYWMFFYSCLRVCWGATSW